MSNVTGWVIGLVVLVVGGAGFYYAYTTSHDDAMMQKDAMTNKDSDTMMKDDTMSSSTDTMMKDDTMSSSSDTMMKDKAGDAMMAQ